MYELISQTELIKNLIVNDLKSQPKGIKTF